jgi:acyl-CoA oxidase
MKIHLPLDGIVIGDTGPKYGYAPMDNAYMLLNNHR